MSREGRDYSKEEPRDQPGVEPALQKAWMVWLHNAIANCPKTATELAAEAGLASSSYLNLMRRGHVPRRDVARALGRALGREEECMLVAGYVPHRGFIKALAQAMKGQKKK